MDRDEAAAALLLADRLDEINKTLVEISRSLARSEIRQSYPVSFWADCRRLFARLQSKEQSRQGIIVLVSLLALIGAVTVVESIF